MILSPALAVGLLRKGGRAGAEPAQAEVPTAACSGHDPCIPQMAGQSLATPSRRDRPAGHAEGRRPSRRSARSSTSRRSASKSLPFSCSTTCQVGYVQWAVSTNAPMGKQSELCLRSGIYRHRHGLANFTCPVTLAFLPNNNDLSLSSLPKTLF